MSSIRSAINNAVRTLLVERRGKAGLNQTQFAQAVGKGQPTISKLETGERYIGIDDFVMLARAVGADPPELLKEAIALANAGESVQKRKARKVTRKATKPE